MYFFFFLKIKNRRIFFNKQTSQEIDTVMDKRKVLFSMCVCRRWMSTWEVCCTTVSWRSSKAGELLFTFLKKINNKHKYVITKHDAKFDIEISKTECNRGHGI